MQQKWHLIRLVSTLLLLMSLDAMAADLVDKPTFWYDDDNANIAEPREREPNLGWDEINDTIVLSLYRGIDFNRWVRHIGTAFGGDHVLPAHNVNALDEVPNNSWFTNRIGLFPMTPEAAARASAETGPDRSTTWTVVSAKTQGVTPGFNIRDAKGDTYLIKFDPKGFLGSTSTANVIVGRLFYAAGFNVPHDVTVRFKRDDLQLGEGVRIKLPDGSRRAMTKEDLDKILGTVDRLPNGEWFAIASKFLDGKPLGPFNYIGRREDDPNDRIPHQDRRELRGLYLFAAWTNHFDTKQHNTLDMFVTEGDRSYVKHYLIDFASTLGSSASGPIPRYGWEYTVDFPATFSRILTLGLYESDWRSLSRPEGLDEVGYWVSHPWDPDEFKPLQPNSAFVNRTARDGYWAAKIITAFRDEHIDAIVTSAGYDNPEAAKYISRILRERRDIIGRHQFDEIPPLDFFWMVEGKLGFRDLGTERGLYPDSVPLYQIRVAAAKASRKTDQWSDWISSKTTSIDLDDLALQGAMRTDVSEYPFLAFDVKVQRQGKWSSTVRAYAARNSQRIVAVER